MANVGLVLSGGFAKGAYQIGVLKALEEFFCRDNIIISASSVGSLNAYAYAAGKLKFMEEEIWRGFDFNSMRSFFRIFARTPFAYNIVDSLTEKDDVMTQNYLYTTCFNFTKRVINYINLRELDFKSTKKYLKASVTLPVFTKAVEISDAKYFDGAMVDNIPVFPLMKHRLDYIIVVHFDNNSYTFENEYFDNKLIKINFLDDKIIKNSFAFDKKTISYMIDTGYEQSKAVFDMIFSNGTENLEYIYEKIDFFNMLKGGKRLRITGDVVVNNINRLLRKIVQK